MNEEGLKLLRRSAVQFRLYEASHRGKIEKFKARNPIMVEEKLEIERLIADTVEKADVNKALAVEIETYLDTVDRSGYAGA